MHSRMLSEACYDDACGSACLAAQPGLPEAARPSPRSWGCRSPRPRMAFWRWSATCRKRSSPTFRTGWVSPPSRSGGRCRSWRQEALLPGWPSDTCPAGAGRHRLAALRCMGRRLRGSFPGFSWRRWPPWSSARSLGPEMPLILAGGGLALLAVRLSRRDVPAQAAAVLAASGSFAAISTLLGNPLSWRLPADGGVRAGRPHARAWCCCQGCSRRASARSSSSAWTT